MTLKAGGCVFFQLPLGNSAGTADPFEPFVSEPAGGPTISGIIYHESFMAVGCNLRLVAQLFNCFDTVKNSCSRRPQFNFINEPEQLHPFAIKAFDRYFDFCIFNHDYYLTGSTCSFNAHTSIVATPI